MEKLSTLIIPISLSTYLVIFCNSFNLIIVISSCQSWKSIRIQFSTSWVKFSSVIFGEFCSKRVNGDDKCSAVRFKLKIEIVLNQMGAFFIQILYRVFCFKSPKWMVLSLEHCIIDPMLVRPICVWGEVNISNFISFTLFDLICFPKITKFADS